MFCTFLFAEHLNALSRPKVLWHTVVTLFVPCAWRTACKYQQCMRNAQNANESGSGGWSPLYEFILAFRLWDIVCFPKHSNGTRVNNHTSVAIHNNDFWVKRWSLTFWNFIVLIEIPLVFLCFDTKNNEKWSYYVLEFHWFFVFRHKSKRKWNYYVLEFHCFDLS